MQVLGRDTLATHMTHFSNWVDFGGMDVYVNATSPGSSHDLFYRDPVIISYFKDYVKAIVTRFQNSDAIFAWELANEVSAHQTWSRTYDLDWLLTQPI